MEPDYKVTLTLPLGHTYDELTVTAINGVLLGGDVTTKYLTVNLCQTGTSPRHRRPSKRWC